MSKYSVLMYVDNTDNLSIQKLGVSKILFFKEINFIQQGKDGLNKIFLFVSDYFWCSTFYS